MGHYTSLNKGLRATRVKAVQWALPKFPLHFTISPIPKKMENDSGLQADVSTGLVVPLNQGRSL